MAPDKLERLADLVITQNRMVASLAKLTALLVECDIAPDRPNANRLRHECEQLVACTQEIVDREYEFRIELGLY